MRRAAGVSSAGDKPEKIDAMIDKTATDAPAAMDSIPDGADRSTRQASRFIGHAAHELKRPGGVIAVVATCIGVGQGLAVALER